MELLIIRHGDPDYTIDSLTEKGWKEAEYLSEKLVKWTFRMLCISPWKSQGYSLLYAEKIKQGSGSPAHGCGSFSHGSIGRM